MADAKLNPWIKITVIYFGATGTGSTQEDRSLFNWKIVDGTLSQV